MPQAIERDGAMSGAATLRTMRAAVLAAPGQVRVEAVARPEPGPRQVRLRLEGCGVCASNLTPWAGPGWMRFPTEPGALGHEGWGVVDAIGERVEGLSIGARVAALSYKAYAEYDLAEADAVIPLPEKLAGRPFPGEPLGCAMNIFRRSEIAAGQTVAIVGIGFLGAALVQLAAAEGARVTALSRRPFALDVARRCGAAQAHELEAAPQREFDVVIEAAGVQETLDVAGRLLRSRGRLVIVGYHQDGPRTVDLRLWNWKGIDVVNAHERDPAAYVQGIRDAVQATVEGRLDPAQLITHRLPLERAGEAFELARTRPDGFLKAVVG
jgi:threonine dehydrogenase-like Zn-dependent dehydrogenase